MGKSVCEPLVLESKKGYIILYIGCGLCSVALLLLCAYSRVFSGILLFFICAVVLFALAVATASHKILIEGKTIFEKRLFRKRKIEFSQVKYLSLKKDNDAEIICVHSDTGIVIKIPKSYQNIEKFEALAIKNRWRWK